MSERNGKSVLFEGTHLRLILEGRWEYVERTKVSGIVMVAAINEQGALLLVEQHRPPLNQRVIEMPAGLAGDIAGQEHEALEFAARRELLEEAGYEAEKMIYLTEGPPSAGLSSEVVTFFEARGLRRVHNGGGDQHEDIQVHEVPLSEVPQWLKAKQRQGLAVDPKVFAGLYFLLASRSSQGAG